jgi:hypothetical protein
MSIKQFFKRYRIERLRKQIDYLTDEIERTKMQEKILLFGPDQDQPAMTLREKQILNDLGALWNNYRELEELHGMEHQEFCHKIHDLQARVLMRPMIRETRKQQKGGNQ